MAYQPNQTVLTALQQVMLVAVVGPSGSGKTTIVRQAIRKDSSLHVVISDVSRPRRAEETDGVDYFFRDKQAMLAAIERREYVQVAPSNSGDFYATHIESYPKTGLAVLTIWAEAIPVFQRLPFKDMRVIFITPPSFETWQKRLGLHDFDTELHQKRLAEARQSFNFALHTQAVQFVVNNDLESATADFIELAHGKLTSKLTEDQAAARGIIQTILQRLPV